MTAAQKQWLYVTEPQEGDEYLSKNNEWAVEWYPWNKAYNHGSLGIYRREVTIPEVNPWRPVWENDDKDSAQSWPISNVEIEVISRARNFDRLHVLEAKLFHPRIYGHTHWRYHIPPVQEDADEVAFEEAYKQVNSHSKLHEPDLARILFKAGLKRGREGVK